jgi:hypothetical protein
LLSEEGDFYVDLWDALQEIAGASLIVVPENMLFQ